MAVSLQSGNLSVGVSGAELDRVRDALSGIDGGAEKAIRAAINDTLTRGRTLLVRKMRENLNLTATAIRDRISIKQQATESELTGVLRIDYKPVPLEDFKARFRQKSGGGVVVKTVKPEGNRSFKHMFRATMGSGHVGVFERNQYEPKHIPTRGSYAGQTIKRGPRKGKPIARQSIKETFGPSILRAFELAPGLADEALAGIGLIFQERLEAKLAWQLDKGKPAPASV